MSNELGPIHYISGQGPLKAVLFDESAQVRNVSSNTWVTIASSPTFANLVISLTEIGTSGIYFGDEPSGVDVTAARYRCVVYPSAATALSNAALFEATLDATVSSRLATGSYTAPLDASGIRSAVGLGSANLDTQLDALPTAAENADAVWDEALSGHTTAGTAGKALSDSSDATDSSTIAADVWSYSTRTLTSAAVVTVRTRQVGTLTVIRGDSYLNADGLAIVITKQSGVTWPSDILSVPWTINVKIEPNAETLADHSSAASISTTGTVVSTSVVRFDLTKAQTATLTLSQNRAGYNYAVVANTGSGASAKQVTLEQGACMVVDDIVTA